MVTPASHGAVEARTELKAALWPHLDCSGRVTLALGFSPQRGRRLLESLAWTFVPVTQRSGIQASVPGASEEAWAPSSHTGKVQGLWASPRFWPETGRPALCAWGRPCHALLVEAGAGFSQDPQQLRSPQREREPCVPQPSSRCLLRCGRAHADALALGLLWEPSSTQGFVAPG